MESLVSFGFLAPPTICITLSLVGAAIALVWCRAGIALALISSLCLYGAATPAVSSLLLRRVEAAVPRDVDLRAAQAIVVLGGDVELGNGADIPDRLGALSLERLVFAAAAYHRLHLPVAVTGGRVADARQSEGALMTAALKADFAVPVTWDEDRSRTTWENAVFTARLLRPAKLTTVVLVTHAWHLPRALWSFDQAGFKALPWPAPRTALRIGRIADFLPRIAALRDTFDGLHELIGGVYYRLRY
ncbi:MAG TPA: YdcF family protein [Stellaceae bacterium]|nr:YdcF family protein [Stellaceae bacterium]